MDEKELEKIDYETYLDDLEDQDIEEYDDNDIYLDNLEDSKIDDILTSFIREIRKYPVLSHEEQQQLFQKYKEENDQESYQKLFHHNLRLTLFVAKRVIGKCETMELVDLIQESCIPLMKAIETYDPSKGVKLSTYCIKVMQREILRKIDEQDRIIKKPIYLEEKRSNYIKLIEEYYIKYGVYPSEEYIKKNLKINDEQLQEINLFPNFDAVSLNVTMSNEKDNKQAELIDFISYDKNEYLSYEHYIDDQIIKKTLQDLLSKRDYYIIYNRIIKENQTLQSIASTLGVTPTDIVKKIKKINETLKRRLQSAKRETIKNYSLKELESMNLEPVDPRIQALYYYLKQNLDEVAYYIMYTRKFNQSNNHKIHYQQKFKSLSSEEIEESIRFCIDLEHTVTNDKIISKIFTELRSKYNTKKIFDLDITPSIHLEYLKISKFFENYNPNAIKETEYFHSLNCMQQKIIEKYFKIPNHTVQTKEQFNQIERDINLSFIGTTDDNSKKVSQEEVEQYYQENKNQMKEKNKKLFESFLEEKKEKKEEKQIIPPNIVYQVLKVQNRLVFDLKSKTRENMIGLLVSKKIKLPRSTVQSIKEYYQIPERKLMSGKEKQKALKLLGPLYEIKRKQTPKVRKYIV